MAKVNWLNDSEMRAWRGYIDVFDQINRRLEGPLLPHGLTIGDYQVLVFLDEAEQNTMRMCDLADRLNLSPSGITRRLDGLVKAGYVARERSCDDGRVMLASITKAGKQKLVDAAPDHVASVREHFIDKLTPKQIEQLGNVFDSLRAE